MSAGFRVGDRVTIPFGPRRVPGVIVEDRGALGVRGQHLYQIRVPMDPFEPETYELPEEEIEVDRETADDRPIEPARIIEYLKHGGLIAILRSNISGGRNQPRVWLRFDTLGNVTHIFAEERGRIGGETVPFWAVHEDHIFAPKRDEVAKFLRSFGLDQGQVRDVISTVGTSPS